MSRSINIIHLSDLHINPARRNETSQPFKLLADELKRQSEKRQSTYDLLIISGDLINKGATNFEPVGEILLEFCNTIDISKEKVFLVPGNHDIDRNRRSNFSHNSIIDNLKRKPPTDFETLDQDGRHQLFLGFESYLQFASHFELACPKTGYLPGYCSAELTIKGLPFKLSGLNTALVAGSDDEGKDSNQLCDRIVDLRFLTDMINDSDKLNLVVSHYPLSWIHEQQRDEVIERLQTSNTIFFHGHVHKPEANIHGIQHKSQLIVLGAGSLFGEKWRGKNQCQILTLCPQIPSPLLTELIWFGNYGWRKFEPIEISWNGWQRWSDKVIPPRQHTFSTDKLQVLGLLDIGKSRATKERISFFHNAIENAAENSEFIIIGRSLIDWAISCSDKIAESIKTKKLCFKIALLDENSIPKNSNSHDNHGDLSWIEKPIPEDWALNDVPNSMRRFRNITVQSGTGSLTIYGLPFYPSHSFVCFTDKNDNMRHCLEETGMALHRELRPYLELKAIDETSYAHCLEKLYCGFLTKERILLHDDGTKPTKRDTTNRAKIITKKIESLGLVDLSVGRSDISWYSNGVPNIIDNTPNNGEIFIIGRSLTSWGTHHRELAKCIIEKNIRCTFAIADPTANNLKSLVFKDFAEGDVLTCFKIFKQNLMPLLDQLFEKNSRSEGSFQLYGLHGYIPTTFASYTMLDGTKFCNLEPGIGVGPSERPNIIFRKVSDGDVFSSLMTIYQGLLINKKPILSFPN